MIIDEEKLLTLEGVIDAKPGDMKKSPGMRRAKREMRLIKFAQNDAAGKWKQHRKKDEGIKKYELQDAAGKWKQKKQKIA